MLTASWRERASGPIRRLTLTQLQSWSASWAVDRLPLDADDRSRIRSVRVVEI